MEMFKYLFFSLPLLILSLIPISICFGYIILSIRLIIRASKDNNIVGLKSGQRNLVKSLLALTITLLICYWLMTNI